MTNREKLEGLIRLAYMGGSKPIEVFVDVDDTLIMWKPNMSHSYNGPLYDTLEDLQKKGLIRITVWSAGGREHAIKMCKEYGMETIVDCFLTKPEIIVDDIPFSDMITRVEPDMYAEAKEYKD